MAESEREKYTKSKPVPKKGPTKYAKTDSKPKPSSDSNSNSVQNKVNNNQQNDNDSKPKESDSDASTQTKKAALVRDKTSIAQFYRDWETFDVDKEVEKIESSEPKKEYKIDVDKYRMQKRTTTARPNVKVAVRSNNRAISNLEFANAKKEEGNRLFQKGRYKDAETAYRVSLTYLDGQRTSDCQSTSVIIRSNIAACLIKHNEYSTAITECTHALDIDPDHIKSLFRRGTSYARLYQWKNAQTDLQRASDLEPTDEKCRSELFAVDRKVEEIRLKMLEHAKQVMQDSTRQPKVAFTKLQIMPKSEVLDFAKSKFIKCV